MRITRDTLMKVVRDTVDKRTRANRGIMSVYLSGSLLEDDYLLGGTTDIDLVIVHSDLIPMEREIVPLTEGIHLDIAHHHHRDYRQTRQLRVHPWLGPTLFKANVLYDPQHFMDFTQASVRGQFHRAEHIIERARPQAEHARQIWLEFYTDRPAADRKVLSSYLRAIDHAINGVASLTGPPLTERRFLLNFPNRAQAVGRPGLYPGLLGLLGAPNVDTGTLQGWLPAWGRAYTAIPPEAQLTRLHPDRRSYYEQAFQAILRSDRPEAVLWPLLRTWTHAVGVLPADAPEVEEWQAAVTHLGLYEGGFEERIKAMDAFLDQIEETLEEWARANGVSSNLGFT